jgi:NAD(P)-dependent dehydrogenase (short-subunit alcohol dehydrogenase family)
MNTSKVVIVTGASQGIGAQTAEAFRQRGHQVIATSRSIGESTHDNWITIAGDIAEPETAQRIVATAIERFGRIDTLVNNAGIFIAKPFTQYTAEDFAAMKRVNVDGFFHITQCAIEQMQRAGSGHIVTITTSLVDHANSSVPSVLASLTKGGLDAATRSLAIEYARAGIRVNALSPGIIKSPMHSPESYSALAALHPMGRMGEMSDVVNAILYLDGAPFVTGEVLHVDGGQVAGH